VYSLLPKESPIRHFTKEGHGAIAEASQGDGANRVARTGIVPVVFMHLFLNLVSGDAMHVAGSNRVDDGEIH
jgi:hypothetical protein